MADYLDRIGQQIGDYRLQRWLGGGGFGNVYLAEQVRDHSQAAVKLLQIRLSRSEELKAFINEARTIRLKHPHIVPLLDFGISREDIPFLVMEYAVQGTLRDRYPKSTQVPLNIVRDYVLQVASALQYAHEQRLIHRDVKPENMLLRADGTILLSDFGIASVAHSSHSLSLHQGIGGTIPYMAPEQIQGQARAASDQYSLGVVVYEWLIGRRPFEGTAAEVALQHMMKLPPSLVAQVPTLSRAVDEVIFKALAKDPKDRFVTVQDFAAALEQAVRRVPDIFPSFMPNQSLPPDMPDVHSTFPIGGSEQVLPPYPSNSLAPSPPLVTPQVTSPHLSEPSLLPPMTEVGSTGQSALLMPPSANVETSSVTEKPPQPIYELPSQARSGLPSQMQAQQQPYPSNAGSGSVPSNATSALNQFPISPHTISVTRSPSLPFTIISSPGQPSQPSAKALSGMQVPRLPSSGAAVPFVAHRGGHLRGKAALLIALALLIIIGSVSILYIRVNTPNAHLQATDTAHTQASTTAHAQASATAIAVVNAYNRGVAANGVMFGFDPQHMHFNPYEKVLNPVNISRLVPYWTASADASPNNAIDCSPAVVNGVVYVCSNNSKLYALDASTGKPRWTASMGSSTESYSSPAIANGVVYVGGSTDSNLQAFDATTGKSRWTAPTGGFAYSSPAVASGVVYVGTFGNGLQAFDATTGKSRWTAPTDSFIYSSPAVANGVVYVGTYFGKLYAFDALTGKSRWTASTGDIIETSPTVANGIVYVSLDGQRLLAFNASTGAALWTAHIGGRLLSSPAVANGVIYVGSLDNKLYAFDATTGKFLWSAPTGDYIETDPTVANGVVYIGSSDGKLYAFDTTTGKFLWSASTGKSIIYSSPAIANGVVYIGSSDGKLYAFHLPGTTS
jgi:outer membrane protein assembly factor BamB/serine/threonine protein kinase